MPPSAENEVSSLRRLADGFLEEASGSVRESGDDVDELWSEEVALDKKLLLIEVSTPTEEKSLIRSMSSKGNG
jgi:hypothetical protein